MFRMYFTIPNKNPIITPSSQSIFIPPTVVRFQYNMLNKIQGCSACGK